MQKKVQHYPQINIRQSKEKDNSTEASPKAKTRSYESLLLLCSWKLLELQLEPIIEGMFVQSNMLFYR
jgi:hypothetical protein